MLSSQALATWGWFGGDATAPNTPTNVEVTTISMSVLLVTWDFDSYAGGFDLYRSTSISGTFSKVNTNPILSLSYYDGQQTVPLSADTLYYYKVKALGPSSDTDSDYSTVASGKTNEQGGDTHLYYYPETIRSVTVALLDMFNDFFIKRYSKTPARDASVVKTVRVPIMFGNTEKRYFDELRGTNEGYQAPPVPRMALTFTGLDYDASRAGGLNEIRHFYNTNLALSDIDSFFSNASPAPYNYSFNLSIQTESVSDFSQIVENILPYFNPIRFLRVKEFAFLNVERDLPVKMSAITPNFSDALEVGDKRKVDGDIQLVVEGWMYKPVDSVKIIKLINVNYFINNSIEDF